ncbi:hypothetical protein A7K91_09020 [Paenibacillus oryzae]|uniref:DUF2508 domain-containing protein n=1 Tax=Paenibacillus oryzae TaxID=1844972 RepID=A0A1A5YQJ9_9BACL|nr:DUF2508 family protein [Paenibacillus oryzae]OBR67853.1 hypothetical protein A7K91_09020 [Paenibacillus oryzae]
MISIGKPEKEDMEVKRMLKNEIAETLRDWENANRFFDCALGKEQVDYAIHAIITIEKRYAMLLAKAKKLQGPWPV